MVPPGRAAALEGLRGYAAGLVFLASAGSLLGARLYGLPQAGDAWPQVRTASEAFLVLLAHSAHGLDLFFPLAAYLVTRLALRRWPGSRPFFARRALRIYPPYAAGLLLAVAAGAWSGRSFGVGDVVANFLLLQGLVGFGIAAINPPTLLIPCVALFQLAAPVLSRVREVPAIGHEWRAGLAAGVLMPFLLGFEIDDGSSIGYFGLFAPGIAMGLLTAEERRRVARATPLGLVLAAWGVFALANKLEWISSASPFYYPASAFACGLVLAKALDAEGLFANALAWRPLAALGRISYSLVLVHFPVLLVVGELLARTLGTESKAAYAAAFLGTGTLASLGVAVALFAAAERPWMRRERPAPLAPPPGPVVAPLPAARHGGKRRLKRR